MQFDLAPPVDLGILKTLTSEEKEKSSASTGPAVSRQQQRFGANIPSVAPSASGEKPLVSDGAGSHVQGMSSALTIISEATNAGKTDVNRALQGQERDLKVLGNQQITRSHVTSSTFDAMEREQREQQQKDKGTSSNNSRGGALFDARDRQPQVYRPQNVDVERGEEFLGGSVGQKRAATSGLGDEDRETKRARTNAATLSPPIEPFCELEQKHLYDYQGRSFLHPTLPPRKKNLDNVVPTKVVQVWKPVGGLKRPGEHGEEEEEKEGAKASKDSSGISALAWCPPYGHLLFAANLGGVVSIFDVSSHKECIARYQCHDKAITSLAVTEGGKKFTTASYDGSIRVWDTESGACLDTILCPEGTTCRCLRYHPVEGNEHFLLSGVGKKILLWDLRTKGGKVAREYDRHLGNVLSITFMENSGARFISSAEDKTIRTWDFNVPVQIQGFADATMHSVPYVAPHPKERTFILQSLDNEAYLMQLNANGNSLKVNKDRKFTGHMVGGSSCTIEPSPDGRFVSSGDVKGNLFFWEYATGKKVKSFRAHGSQLVQHLWHPTLPGLVATGSWDGAVKLWSS